MTNKTTLTIKGTEIVLVSRNQQDYISLTDMAHYRDPERSDYLIQNWMRINSTIEYLGLWETFYNPDFNSIIFDGIKTQTGQNSFSMTPKRWVKELNGIGIFSKTGRYGGGVFAHQDIAFEFATWLSTEFKFYLVKEFQRLKAEENQRLSAEWNLQRTLAKINYHIHTDAIKEHLIPKVVNEHQKSFTYADEADLLNVALFGKTAAHWREENPQSKGNIRDEATLEQLIVLSNMESINALLIRDGLSQSERLTRLNATAITQLESLFEHGTIKKLNSDK